ncbi:MAG: galactosyldiacylglycerol synthase [Planctomycetes bacterium]|nr:galactosyldiacylglycerol synthase [Planctomycetota bacterium]
MRAAQALAAAAALHRRDVTTVHIDVMDLVPRLFRKLYAESYLTLVDLAPSLWGSLYRGTDTPRASGLITRLRQAVERMNTGKLIKRLRELDADAVICTHFLPAQLLSRLTRRGQFDRPVWVQVTDYDVHGMWIHDHLAGYFAADAEIAWRMRDRGLAKSAVHATGIPIMPVFAERLERTVCAAELGIDPARTTLLMMSGGFGVGAIDELAERVLRSAPDLQVIALAGKNAALLARLALLAKRHPGRLFPQGFTKTIERVMACADLAITKPGGLTTAECLAVGLPLIVISPIPGQEERNATFLLEHGAALMAYDAAGLEYRVRQLLADPKRLRAMAADARRLGKPGAAWDVLQVVLRGHAAAETGRA